MRAVMWMIYGLDVHQAEHPDLKYIIVEDNRTNNNKKNNTEN